MDRAKLGMLLLNDHTANCLKTIAELLDTTRIWSEEIKLSLIWCEETVPGSKEKTQGSEHIKAAEVTPEEIQELDPEMITDELLIEYAKVHNISVYTSGSDGFRGRFRKAVEEMNAEYLHVIVPNISYTEEFWTEVFAGLTQDSPDGLVTKVSIKNPAPIVKEHNGYINRILQFSKQALAEGEEGFYPYHLIHSMFYSYFIKKEQLHIELLDELSQQLCWELQVLYLYTCSLAEIENWNVAGSALKKNGYSGIYSWKLLSEQEHAKRYVEEFLSGLYEFCKRNPENKNAKYNLLYYLKMMIQNHPKDEASLKKLRKKTEEILSIMQEEELILDNQYFDRVLKKHILETVQWKESHHSFFREKKESIFQEEALENTIVFLKLEANRLTLEGRCTMYGEEPFEIYIDCSQKEHKCEIVTKETFRQWFDQNITHTQYYSCQIPLVPGETYDFGMICKKAGKTIRKERINFSLYSPLTEKLELFEKKDGWLMYYDQGKGRIILKPDQKGTRILLKCKRAKSFLTGDKIGRKALVARGIFSVMKFFKKKEVWLISDRISRGDDNGECFFRYLSEHPQKDVNAYFVVDKHCPAYRQMKKYGKVISVYSWKHKMYHLLSDYVISSQANKPVINPFGKIFYHYSDILYDKKIVFLQHGVTKDDQSAWLNRYNRNLYGFVVATKAEYNSIFEADYFYKPENVWLTGMPRYDRLYRDEKKYITIMPTWRKALSAGTTAAGEWKVSDSFVESAYFKFYNGLLNHQRLIKEAQDRGYTICFMPHPNITPALPFFDRDERVQFWDAGKSYRDVFAQADLMVTDYSSVAFDFAYLRKPIVYSQFDREEFFSGGHSYTEGYYNYETDGFGEIVETLEELVDKLIQYMDNGCELKEEYRKRIENTFAYADTNCCARVLEKIRNRE